MKIFFLVSALWCIGSVCHAIEQDDEKYPDIAIAAEYHRINGKKNDTHACKPDKTCTWKIRAYTGALIIALLVYTASDTSDTE